ncbi:glycosyltransferase family 4 protein [Nonomuraea cavernae]|uniref:Glycosyl transferase n=1 Tax=Nonomuraea cavernae TaxID=2045107 RepID=A0A918DNV8_9ACTN|nr:glycosyltransferase family 4 protein [Nonomuraea cavernae]MCA2189060.1 glycosyltransferase family 4 protein [Nonomuraea cavernae]GGO76040.1 glycosyl transferase [Nonomuraea cavernae]
MRVAFVLGTTSGGTGRHVHMLVEGLVRRGHQVLVVGPRSVEERFSYTGAGARFAEVTVSDRPHPFNDARAVLAIRRLTRGADVVHAHGLRAGALAALGRRSPRRGSSRAVAARAPLVVTLHNALTAGGLIGLVYGLLERVVAGRADRVLVVSPDLGERMAALGARDVRAAVVPAPPPPPARRGPEEVRAELGAGRRPVLLTIARLAQQKGLDTLLDVARGPWPDDDPERSPLFVVAGEGPLREPLQARIDAERLPVTLLGNRDDVPDLLAAATAVVATARWEGQPLSLSETLMVGRPVIATEVGGIPGLLGGAGVLVPYGDVEALRRAVQELVGDPGAVERMAEASARRGAELPDADDAVERIMSDYGQEDRTKD